MIHPSRVCVIEADEAVRDSLVTLIQLSHDDVAEFATGQAFLDASAARQFDCVICAQELPDISGVEVYCAFRHCNPDARFALLVSARSAEAAHRASHLGVDAVLYKPLVSLRLREFVSPGNGPGQPGDNWNPQNKEA